MSTRFAMLSTRTKTVTIALGLALPTLALTACGNDSGAAASSTPAAGTTPSAVAGSSQPATTKPLQIAFFNPVATNTYTAAVLEGLTAQAKEVGATVTNFDAKFDASTQVNQMQDALATGKFDAFVVIPVNNAGLIPVAKEATGEGVTVVSVLSTIGTDLDTLKSSVDGVITIGQTFTANGNDLADQVVKACAGANPCEVAYMPGDAKQASEKTRKDAVLAKLAAVSSIKVVSTQPGGFDANTGLATAQDIITAHPEVQVIAASAGQAIGGALQAVKQAGLTGKVKLVSNGATTDDVTGIRAGTIFSSPVFLPRTEGVQAVKLIAEAATGKKVPTEVDELQFSTIGRIADKDSLSTPVGQKFTGEYASH